MSYQNRISKIQKWMGEQGIDLVLLTSPASVMYVSGFFSNPHERFMGAVIPRVGDPFLQVPALDRDKAAKGGLAVRSHSDQENALAMLKKGLPSALGNPRVIAIEKGHMTVARLEELQAHFSGASYRNATDIVNTLRLQKDPQEISIMRRAAKLADDAVAFLASKIAVGQKEYELVQAVESYVKQQGAQGMAFETMVLAGENTALPHGVPGMNEIREGDLVLIDLGVVVDGYCSDITRTFAVGRVNDRQKEIYQTVLNANMAAINVVKPGISASDVDKAARNVIEQAGYGEYFTHRVGHGLGIEIHESPSMHSGNDSSLVAGMTFTIEPGIYLPGVGGVRIEDDILVTEKGAEILTSFPKHLQIL